jgi:serpin B
LEDDQATGFMKRYQGGEYAFVALLPKEGVSVSEYVESLNGEKLHTMLSNPQYETVLTSIPKFEAECDLEMSQILKTMGMPNAFDAIGADFTGLGTSTEGNICIDRVLHKTFISVGEKGTKAGASTVIEMTDGAMLIPQENKMVYLERPFIYMLIDCDNHIPFFIGTMMDMKN